MITLSRDESSVKSCQYYDHNLHSLFTTEMSYREIPNHHLTQSLPELLSVL